jgi:hypothetical protein
MIGVEIDPIKRLFVCDSTNKWIVEIPQLKKIKDSYKLLNGKYPSPIHLPNKVNIKRKLLIMIAIFPILKEISFFLEGRKT